MRKYNKHLIVIAGPTAVGKTCLSIKIARALHTEIISADSRQFYREMNIGTAKPSATELAAIPHHLTDFLSVQNNYDVKTFEKDALQALDRIFKNSDVAVAAGGSGLFIKTLCEGIDAMPSADSEIRENLNRQLDKDGLMALTAQLKQLDPAYYDQVDLANPRRVLRALEVCLSSGRPYSEYRQHTEKSNRPFSILKIGLERNRPDLYQRIDQRVDAMLSRGLLQEVASLYAFRDKNAMQTVGYREIIAYLDQHYDLPEAIRLIKRNTRRFAKRQLTWFKKDPAFNWFLLTDEDDKNFTLVFDFIRHRLNL